MKGFDPIQDTFNLAAGGRVKRTRRPGEELPAPTLKQRIYRFSLTTLGQIIILAGIAILVITVLMIV